MHAINTGKRRLYGKNNVTSKNSQINWLKIYGINELVFIRFSLNIYLVSLHTTFFVLWHSKIETQFLSKSSHIQNLYLKRWQLCKWNVKFVFYHQKSWKFLIIRHRTKMYKNIYIFVKWVVSYLVCYRQLPKRTHNEDFIVVRDSKWWVSAIEFSPTMF